MPRTRPLYHPALRRLKRGRFSLLGDFGYKPAILQPLAGELGVIASIQIHARPIERDSNRLRGVFESGDQKRRIVAIGWGAETPYGDALSVYGRGALGALFAPVHRAPACLLAAARSFGCVAVYRHLRKLEADVSVVGFEHYRPQGVDHTSLYPLVAALAQRGGRAPFVGDPLVGAAEDQHLHQLLEDHPVGDARAVAPERMARLPLRYQGRKLLPDGLDEVRWERGHGHPPSSGSLENSPDDGASRARLPADALPIRASS